MVRRTLLISTCEPTMSRVPPNADCQVSYDNIATGGPFGTVSDGSNARPSIGLTPSTWNSPADTRPLFTRRGRSAALRLAWFVANAPTAENARVRSWNSRNSGGDTQNWSNPILGNWLEMNTSRSGSG